MKRVPLKRYEVEKRFTQRAPCPIHQRLCPYDAKKGVVYCARCGREISIGAKTGKPERG
jgi:hypothetical protein